MAPHENLTVCTSGQQGDLILCRAEISEEDVKSTAATAGMCWKSRASSSSQKTGEASITFYLDPL